jgi:hypothetical protein
MGISAEVIWLAQWTRRGDTAKAGVKEAVTRDCP